MRGARNNDISGQSFTASGLRDSSYRLPFSQRVIRRGGLEAGSGRMERIIKSRAEATRDQATLRAQQSPWNVRGRANGQEACRELTGVYGQVRMKR